MEGPQQGTRVERWRQRPLPGAPVLTTSVQRNERGRETQARQEEPNPHSGRTSGPGGQTQRSDSRSAWVRVSAARGSALGRGTGEDEGPARLVRGAGRRRDGSAGPEEAEGRPVVARVRAESGEVALSSAPRHSGPTHARAPRRPRPGTPAPPHARSPHAKTLRTRRGRPFAPAAMRPAGRDGLLSFTAVDIPAEN